MLLGKCQAGTDLWSLWSTLRQSQNPEVAFPFPAEGVNPLEGTPRGSGRDPSPCACLMCSHYPPDGRDRSYQLQISWRTCLQQGFTLPGAPKNREKPRLHPRVNPRQHPQINSGSLATKPHRGSVQTPQPGWFAETLGFSVP